MECNALKDHRGYPDERTLLDNPYKTDKISVVTLPSLFPGEGEEGWGAK